MPRLPFRKSAPEPIEPLVLPASDERRRPSLVVLTPLASGVTSFDLRQFADSSAAQDYLQQVFDAQLELPRGLVAFWALQNPPPDVRDNLEPVVIIGSPDRRSIACPYFFTDAASVQSYAWTKLVAGIPASSISIYLALVVDIRVNKKGLVSLSPAYPPPAPRSRQPLAGDALGSDGGDSGGPARRRGSQSPESLPRRV